MYWETEAQEARAKAVELLAEAERLKGEQQPDAEGEPPSETPTTFSDCAAIYHHASAEATAAAAAFSLSGRRTALSGSR